MIAPRSAATYRQGRCITRGKFKSHAAGIRDPEGVYLTKAVHKHPWINQLDRLRGGAIIFD
jgi:hypothetical protein